MTNILTAKTWTEEELLELPKFSMWLPSKYNDSYRVHQTITVNGIDIDENLAPLLSLLWEREIQTIACCQGHPAEYHISNGQQGEGYILFCNFDQAVEFLRFTIRHFTHSQDIYHIKLMATKTDSLGQAIVQFSPLLIQSITTAWKVASKESK